MKRPVFPTDCVGNPRLMHVTGVCAPCRHSGMRVRTVMPNNISERVSEPDPPQSRGRSKYSAYQGNFKTGRKSSSLMNLCGKDTLIRSRFTFGNGGWSLSRFFGAMGSFWALHLHSVALY